ncbi:hypothetical protein LCI18_002413 [Fusarium solani-melongenae]|uniref:Uncharacterized protein n=1 Tax=Fusarium solani subsp. cucurbitae TaxID=2747967 RepID=A0ACD3YR94_FUSSC|nr:hypothetical protein LCI18_002413 [Fusarium solani-melongenae]
MTTEDVRDASPTDNEYICPACLNLEYNRFDVSERFSEPDRYPAPRSRRINRERIIDAAQKFCPICAVLDEGMATFWGDESWEAEEESEYSYDDNTTDENEDETPDSETGDEAKQDYAQSLVSGSSENSSKGEPYGRPNISIELRPGRSLFLRRLDLKLRSDLTDRLGRIEFSTNESRGAVPVCHLSPDSAAGILKRWLKSCDKHEQCSVKSQSPPKRLIDISSDEQILIETKDHPLICWPYTTLSHCWGNLIDAKPLQTTKNSYEARMRGIDWEELPTLFQDVIILLRKLGLSYLWIDSVCIIQDDDDDWLEQSAQMAGIYSHSYLNLAAATSENSSQSLFRTRFQVFADVDASVSAQSDSSLHPDSSWWPSPEIHCERWTTGVIQPMDTSKAAVLVRPPNLLGHGSILGNEYLGRALECPLLDRAWVYQEKLLAPRTAFFSRSELMWQCRESVACECKDMDNNWNILPEMEAMLEKQSPAPPLLLVDCWEKRWFDKIQRNPPSVDVSRQARDFWHTAVTQYASMALTRESDRAYAIAGVALKIQEATNDKYLAGLWLPDLPLGLAWGNYPFLKEYKNATRLGGGIPSWSWMSLQRGESYLSAAYGLFESFETDPRIRIIEEGTWCRTDGHQFGAVRSGQIELEAASLAVAISITDESNTGFSFSIPGREDDDEDVYQFLADCPCDPTEGLKDGDSVLLLLLGKATLMEPLSICLAVKPAEGIQGAYRRVGIAFDDVDILERGAPPSRFILI